VSADLRQLYHDLIVDHSKRPRNFRKLETARKAEGYNPLCGDKVTVYVDLVNDVLADVAFKGTGCAISTASASVMTEAVKGKSPAEAATLCETFRAVVTRGAEACGASQPGPLAAFAGVHEFPSRVKCALLAWQTLEAAIRGGQGTVSTG
jgi:nitrogen fixation NifU-like protein